MPQFLQLAHNLHCNKAIKRRELIVWADLKDLTSCYMVSQWMEPGFRKLEALTYDPSGLGS